MKDEWISVKDRRPEKEEAYLIYPNKYHFIALYNLWGKFGDKWTVTDSLGYHSEIIVTHWMPLPLPPKKDESKVECKHKNIRENISGGRFDECLDCGMIWG